LTICINYSYRSTTYTFTGSSLFFLSSPPPTPTTTLFPYTTLFRSYRYMDGTTKDKTVPVEKGQTGETEAPGQREGYTFLGWRGEDRKSTRLNSSHVSISYAVFCLKKKNNCRACFRCKSN